MEEGIRALSSSHGLCPHTLTLLRLKCRTYKGQESPFLAESWSFCMCIYDRCGLRLPHREDS